jgi:hypothetical protein
MAGGGNSILGAQALTFAIPLGTFLLVCLWGFFQRRPHRRSPHEE